MCRDCRGQSDRVKALSTAREAHMKEEIAQALAWETEICQRDREMRAAVIDRERSQFQTKLALHQGIQGYSMLLVGELRAARLPVSVAP